VDARYEEPALVEVLARQIGVGFAGDAVVVDSAGEEPAFLDDVEAIGEVALVGDDGVVLEGLFPRDPRHSIQRSRAQVGENRQFG